jgi:hypothetical protein
MIQNIIVLLLVLAAAVYTVTWLRRLSTGESKCACGSNCCGSKSKSCDSGNCNLVSLEKPSPGGDQPISS